MRDGLIVLCLFSVLAGCAASDDAELTDEVGEGYTGGYSVDVHELMSDEDLTGGQSITARDLQAFLESKGSTLAKWVDRATKQSAAARIVAHAHTYAINPVYLLARIQVESGLITSASSTNLSKATGCGCPDTRPCDPRNVGFDLQVECAAERMRSYLTSLEQTGQTIAEITVNKKAFKTADPCWVKPANKATAALYTYTPWVGRWGKQCRNADALGSSGLAMFFHGYKATVDAIHALQ